MNFRVCHRDQSSNKSLFDFIYVCLLQIPFSDMLEENWNRLGRDESMNEYNLTKHCGTIQVRGKICSFCLTCCSDMIWLGGTFILDHHATARPQGLNQSWGTTERVWGTSFQTRVLGSIIRPQGSLACTRGYHISIYPSPWFKPSKHMPIGFLFDSSQIPQHMTRAVGFCYNYKAPCSKAPLFVCFIYIYISPWELVV